MSGIETMFRPSDAAQDSGHVRLDPDVDEEEIVTGLLGLRLFTVPDQPDNYRVLLRSTISPTDAEHAALPVVLGLLDRFKEHTASKVEFLLRAPEIEPDLKVQVLSALMTMSGVQDSLALLLRLMSEHEALDVLMPKEIIEALGLVKANREHTTET